MWLLVLLLAIILLVAVAILCIKRRLFGVIVSIVGVVGLGISCLARAVYGAFADNPGIVWKNPSGIPYSDIYSAQFEATTPYIVGSIVLIILGILWSVRGLTHHRR